MLGPKVIISVPSRLHLTLIGMDDVGYRKNGGIGFAIREPRIVVEVALSDEVEVIDERKIPLAEDEVFRLTLAIRNVYSECGLKKSCKVTIKEGPESHRGFGTGTAIRLASLEGILILNKTEISIEELVLLSGRGKTSGVGVSTYFSGGMVFDCGSKNDGGHTPSFVAEKGSGYSKVVSKLMMPDWDVGICIPDSEVYGLISEKEETEFFRTNTPLSYTSTLNALYLSVYGLLPAVLENEIYVFSKAVREIQSCEWKGLERKLYGRSLLNVERKLYDAGAEGVGMSSLGPALFFMGNNVGDIVKRVDIHGCKLIKTKPDNNGREISNV